MPINVPRTTIWTARTAVLAGLAWATLGLDSLLRPAPERYRDALLLAPWTLTLLSLAGIFWLQRGRSGLLGAFSFVLVATAMLATAIGQIAVVMDISRLASLGFPVGLVAWSISMGIFGLAVIRAGVLPRWAGVAIALAEPLVVATALALSPIAPIHPYGSYSGAIVHGVIWAAIGLAIWWRARPTAERSPRHTTSGAFIAGGSA